MKRFSLLITMIISLASIISAQTTISISGNIYGPSCSGAVDNMFTIVFSNGGGTVKSGGWVPGTTYTEFVNTALPYGWYGTITVTSPGFIYTPSIDSTTGKFPLVKNPTMRTRFDALDTMKPRVYFRKPFQTLQLNSTDTIKTTVYDNCLFVTKYLYEISYNKGSSWAVICSLTAIIQYGHPSFPAVDTAAIQCRKSQAFTPTQAADSCQIRVTVYDREGNFGSVVSPAFKVDNPTSTKISPKFTVTPKTVHPNFDVAGRKIYAPREHSRIYICRKSFSKEVRMELRCE